MVEGNQYGYITPTCPLAFPNNTLSRKGQGGAPTSTRKLGQLGKKHKSPCAQGPTGNPPQRVHTGQYLSFTSLYGYNDVHGCDTDTNGECNPKIGMKQNTSPSRFSRLHSGECSIWLHHPCLLRVPIMARIQYAGWQIGKNFIYLKKQHMKQSTRTIVIPSVLSPSPCPPPRPPLF